MKKRPEAFERSLGVGETVYTVLGNKLAERTLLVLARSDNAACAVLRPATCCVKEARIVGRVHREQKLTRFTRFRGFARMSRATTQPNSRSAVPLTRIAPFKVVPTGLGAARLP